MNIKSVSLFLFTAAYSFSVHAQEVQPTSEAPTATPVIAPTVVTETKSSTDFGKQSYLPSEGSLFLNLGFSSATVKSSINGPAGVVADIKNSLVNFNYTAGYGLSDYLSVGTIGRIQLSNSEEISYGPGSTINGTSDTSKSTGWEEPTLAAIWRISDNENKKLRMHFGVAAQPKLQKAKYATTSSNGNEGIGGSQFSVSLEVFKEVKNLEFSISAYRFFKTLSVKESASDSTKTSETTDHQSTEFKVGLYGSTSENSIFGGGLLFTSTEPYQNKSVTNSVVSSTTSYDSTTSSELQLVGIFKIEPTSYLKVTLNTLLDFSQAGSVGTTKLNRSATGGRIALDWAQEF